jgi:hypothetical protein
LGVEIDAASAGAAIGLTRVDASAVRSQDMIPGVWFIELTVPNVMGFSGQVPLTLYANGAASYTASIWLQ